jgi:hypothetical protein
MLQANRELADKAEVSRFTELRGFMDEEVKRQATLGTQSRETILARLEQLDIDLRTAIEQSGNTLSAYIGEMEDRLENGVHSMSPRPPI